MRRALAAGRWLRCAGHGRRSCLIRLRLSLCRRFLLLPEVLRGLFRAVGQLRTGVGPMPQFFSSVGNSRSLSRAASASDLGRVDIDEQARSLLIEQYLGRRRVIAPVILLQRRDPAIFERRALADPARHLRFHAADDLFQPVP